MRKRKRAQRIEALEIDTRTHPVFAETFTCACGEDVTGTVRRRMTDGGRFCNTVVAYCQAGHLCEYRSKAAA